MRVIDLGLVAYREAWDFQVALAQEVAEGGEDALVLVEHPPVLTLGASFQDANLLMAVERYRDHGIDVVRTDRGGDVTYHGPGQLVMYPVFDVARHGRDLHVWLRSLEEAVITALKSLGLEGRRFPPHTGVWTGPANDPKKVAAIGIKVKRWVNLHGIALNCDNDLRPFSLIVPCGIHGYGVTSVSEATGRRVGPDRAKGPCVEAFGQVFPDA
jgi:lipoate-protein ligase B